MAKHQNTLTLIATARAILADHHPMTVRQVYYQLVSRQVIENNRGRYQAVSNALVDARKEGTIPWEWIEDRIRRPRGVRMWDDPADFAETAKRLYRRDVDSQLRSERRDKIVDMWQACYTQEEIAGAVRIPQQTIADELKDLPKLEELPKSVKLAAAYQDDFEPELYDIWNFAKKTNEVKHFGNTEVRIVDNLLYTFTQPFDIVVDPFAGGGSTIDICKKRSRRYWASDRNPVVERSDIRHHDLTESTSGPARWADVALVYLDPPYWCQAAGKYSDDPTDLANMTKEQFTDALVGIIHGYAAKLKSGAHLACIISPTQWPNEDKHVDYHDIDLACKVKKLDLVRRVICPYSSEQYNGTQVNIAKERKLWMVLSRTMLGLLVRWILIMLRAIVGFSTPIKRTPPAMVEGSPYLAAAILGRQQRED